MRNINPGLYKEFFQLDYIYYNEEVRVEGWQMIRE